jgi:alpha-tubulin suppressor-like RCC1 family protein
VEQPAGTILTDGGATINFGALILVGAATERAFTVRNTGPGDLTGLGISIDGAHAGDFHISAPPALQVDPGGSTTFAVRFSPTGSGSRSATLRVASNDHDENPFDISLTGTATSAPLAAGFSNGTDIPLTTVGFTATGKTVNFSLNFAPTRGANLKVVNNIGLGFIQGTFSNLTNGAPVDLIFGGITYHFVASYYGGDGNDLVLLWRDTGLSAWGSNGYGQFGNGSTTNSNVPVMVDLSGGVLADKTIVALAGGNLHSLALCSDGTLAAWGANGYGQLGDGTTTSSHVPVAVDRSGVLAGKTVVSLAAGGFHSMALCSDGTVAVWGENSSGVLGDGSTSASRIAPVQLDQSGVLAGKTVVAIAAGRSHSMALCSDGTLAAWGLNSLGQLGNGTPSALSNVPVLVNQSVVLARKTVVAMAAGIWHSLVLCSDGTMAAWGSNAFGQLGNGTSGSSSSPVLVNQTGVLAGKSVTAISVGSWHCLALCSDGTLTGWGDGFGPQLDNGMVLDSNVPAQVDQSGVLAGKTVVAVSAGSNHSLALCSDGAIAAWGGNASGQLGDGSNTVRNTPVLVDRSGALGGNPILSTSKGSEALHTLALVAAPPEIVVEQSTGTELTDGGSTVDFGALPLVGAATERTLTIRNTGRGDLTGLAITFDGPNASDFKVSLPPARQVAPGGFTTFKVRFSPLGGGGRSAALRLASNDIDENPFDIALTGTGGATTTLAASFSNSSEAPLSTAGFAATGNTVSLSLHFAPTPGTQLRLVNNTGSGFIVGAFSNLTNGAPVNLSHNGITYHFVAWYYGGDGNDLVLLWRDTALAAWGENFHGQLGDGSNTDRSLPGGVVESGILAHKTVVALSSGISHSLALCSDGTLAAWGINTSGELGNGSTTNSNIPVAVAQNGALSGKSVIALAAGGSHNLALCSDGTIAAWGWNLNGQLGNGSTTSRTSPVVITQGGILAGKTIVALSAGISHSLALCSDGTIAAWGGNASGQLGNGSNTGSNVPVLVNQGGILADKTVVAVAACGRHNLALCSDGTLAAWGENATGQLGNGSNTSSNVPVLVDQSSVLAGKTAIALSAGISHSLALCSDGTLAAWGENTSGQLGNGSNTNSNVPVLADRSGVLADKTAVAIAAGSNHNLALCSDSTLATWGHNNRGQLGDGSNLARNVPVLVDPSGLLSGNPIIAVYSDSTGGHSLALYPTPPEIVVEQPVGVDLTDGNATIEFAVPVFSGATTERVFTVRNTGSGELAGSISIDGAHSADFSVVGGSGINVPPDGSATFTVRFSPSSHGSRFAALRLASNDADENPFDISLTGAGTAISTLAASYNDGSEVPLTSADFTATGNMVNFSLGYAPARGSQLMVVENTGSGFIKGTFSNLANGASVELSHEGIVYHFVAWYYGGDGNDIVLLWRDTGLAAWGLNSSGQLGNGSLINRNVPVAVTQSGVLAGKTVVALASGDGHSLGLCSDGTLASWGLNSSGQLGNGSFINRNVPGVVLQSGALAGKTVVALAAGGSHSMALCSDGTLVTWGLNSSGQLGNGANLSRHVPVDITQSGVLAGKTVVALAAGDDHSLALCSDGVLAAWGSNVEGKLGDGSNTSSNVPVLVDQSGVFTGRIIVDFSAGGSHSLALCSDGTLAAWGRNISGQLGIGSTTDRNVPTAVTRSGVLAGKTVVALAAGGAHSLALCSDGTLAAWGYGFHGQLGNMSNSDSTVPVLVDQSGILGGKSVVGFAAGIHHSLAFCSDGNLAAWGHNSHGQLGKGDATPVNFPSAITHGGIFSGNPILRALSGPSALHSLALYAAPPEIVVEQPVGIGLSDGSSTIDFGAAVLVGAATERRFTIRNTGPGELSGLAVAIDGTHAGEFTVSSPPALQVAPGGSTTFTVRFDPSSLGPKTAALHLVSNDTDENSFDILLTGTSKPGAHIDIGDSLNLDLSWVPIGPGETFRVLGLPPGLAFNFGPPPAITGTVLGGAPNGGVWIRILRGNTAVKTIPFELSVDPSDIDGSFELLLEEAGQPTGMIRLTVTGPSTKAQSPAYSATLVRLGEPRRTAKGAFSRTAYPQAIPLAFPAFQGHPAVNFDLTLSVESDRVVGATNPSSGLTTRGFRLVRPGRAPAGNPALTLTLPPDAAGERTTVPGGIGHASGMVNSKSLVPLSGLLGDAQRFATALSLSRTNQAVVWITPYKNRQSYLGGIIEIGEMGAANRAASMEAASNGLLWKREGDPQELSYPDGFGPLALSADTSRWVPTPTADGLAQSLGLEYRAIDVSYIAPTADVLPNRLSLRDGFSLLRMGPADSVPFTGKAIAKTGNFAASVALSAPAAKSAVNGVLIQNDGFSPIVGRGLVRIPVTGPGLVKGAFQTAGIELLQTSAPADYRYRVGSTVTIDLSFIFLQPDETLKVTGLPAGLVFNSGPSPNISGTVLGPGSSAGVQIQVLKGKQITRTIPLDIAVEGYAWEGSYELLLEAAGRPAGKLKVIVNPPTTRSPTPAYSATLERLGEARRSAKGSFAATGAPQTVTVVFPSEQTYPAVTFSLILSAGSDLVTGKTSPASAVTARGFRLARLGRIPTGNPALTMAFPPAVKGNRVNTPGGIGFAKGSINSRALVPMTGQLGDAQAFAASLSLSQTNQAVVWITPYSNKASYFGGIINLGKIAAPDHGASLNPTATGLKWARVPDSTAPSYRAGFGPLDLDATPSSWVPSGLAEALGESLDLVHRDIRATYIAPTTSVLPTVWSLRDNFTLIRIYPSDSVFFVGKIDARGGGFGGTLTLPASQAHVTGAFLQDGSFGELIGQGLVKIPLPGLVKGSFETSGVELRN